MIGECPDGRYDGTMVVARKVAHNRAKAKKSRILAPTKPRAARTRTASATITDTMRVADISALLPDSVQVLAEYGIHCAGCSMNGLESLAEGCRLHGFDDADIADLVSDLNDLLRAAPDRPATLTITREAAKALEKVMKQEGHIGDGFLVTLDGNGGFCMEFRTQPQAGEKTFSHREAPSVRIFASPLTLTRIGGSTIDFREERFKLDLPEDGCCG